MSEERASKSRSRSHSRSKDKDSNSKSKSKSRKACRHLHRTGGGKLTNNPFLNFLRLYRLKHCDWPMTKIAVEGARKWCSMAEEKKDKFRAMAKAAHVKYPGKRGRSGSMSRCGCRPKSRHGRKRSSSRRRKHMFKGSRERKRTSRRSSAGSGGRMKRKRVRGIGDKAWCKELMARVRRMPRGCRGRSSQRKYSKRNHKSSNHEVA